MAAQESDHPHIRGPALALCSCEGLHINLCKWRLWLYFYKLETTGLLLSKREGERERESASVAERKHSYLQDITISQICHYSVHLWKDRFGDKNLQTKGEKGEIHQSDKTKWSLSQKMMRIKRSKWEQTNLQDQGFSGLPASSGAAQRTHSWWSQEVRAWTLHSFYKMSSTAWCSESFSITFSFTYNIYSHIYGMPIQGKAAAVE